MTMITSNDFPNSRTSASIGRSARRFWSGHRDHCGNFRDATDDPLAVSGERFESVCLRQRSRGAARICTAGVLRACAARHARRFFGRAEVRVKLGREGFRMDRLLEVVRRMNMLLHRRQFDDDLVS